MLLPDHLLTELFTYLCTRELHKMLRLSSVTRSFLLQDFDQLLRRLVDRDPFYLHAYPKSVRMLLLDFIKIRLLGDLKSIERVTPENYRRIYTLCIPSFWHFLARDKADAMWLYERIRYKETFSLIVKEEPCRVYNFISQYYQVQYFAYDEGHFVYRGRSGWFERDTLQINDI